MMEDSAQRQRELEKGFLSVLNTQNYEDISVSDLCKQLGISRKCFYRYFSGKDGILTALLDHTLMDFEASFSQYTLSRESAGEILEEFFRFWKEHKSLLDALERNSFSTFLYQRALNFTSRETSIFSLFVLEEDKFLRNQRIQFIVCGLMTMAISWHHTKYQPAQKQMVLAARQLLTQPLFRD